MANTYAQIYIQVIYAVQGRQNLLRKEHKEELHKYTTGIVRNHKQKLIAINSMPDHVHILIGLRPSLALSDLIAKVKSNSSLFINEKKWVRGRFNWQEGFGAFSYGHSQLSAVIRYIQDQEKHHIRRSFKQEYLELLKKFNVEYDGKYVFDWIGRPTNMPLLRSSRSFSEGGLFYKHCAPSGASAGRNSFSIKLAPCTSG
jgi:putative transposase